MTIFLFFLVITLVVSNAYMIMLYKKMRSLKEAAEKEVAEANRKMIEADSKCICRGLGA